MERKVLVLGFGDDLVRRIFKASVVESNGFANGGGGRLNTGEVPAIKTQ